jgi:hypothetical protein
MDNKVVFLAHRNDSIKTEVIENLSCRVCSNKTWAVVYDESRSSFPRMQCACCGTSAGHFGWVADEEAVG